MAQTGNRPLLDCASDHCVCELQPARLHQRHRNVAGCERPRGPAQGIQNDPAYFAFERRVRRWDGAGRDFFKVQVRLEDTQGRFNVVEIANGHFHLPL